MKKKSVIILGLPIVLAGVLAGGYALYHYVILSAHWQKDAMTFILAPQEHADWVQPALTRCGLAPFQMPTSGYIGYLWDVSFRPLHRHQGVDIFGGTEPGVTPVYAVYDGYLTRQSDWKSSLILRIPDDPLHPGRQIWVYYTHMAMPDGSSTISADFPAGTKELLVKAGTLLGTQGNYSGTPDNPVGVHLHISIVRDDGHGRYTNELRIRNTYDPSPYFGLPLNAASFPKMPILCN